MRMIFFLKKPLLNIHAVTVYPLQSRLLEIEYSDSSVAATLYSSGGSLHLRCCSKPSSQLSGRFQLSQKWCSLRWVLSLGYKTKSHGAKSGLYGGWGSVVILFWVKNSLTANDVWLGALSWWRNHLSVISQRIRWTSVFGSPTSSAINRTFKRRSLSRTAFTQATFFSVLEIEGRPARCLSSTHSFPSFNAFYHLKTWAKDKTTSS